LVDASYVRPGFVQIVDHLLVGEVHLTVQTQTVVFRPLAECATPLAFSVVDWILRFSIAGVVGVFRVAFAHRPQGRLSGPRDLDDDAVDVGTATERTVFSIEVRTGVVGPTLGARLVDGDSGEWSTGCVGAHSRVSMVVGSGATTQVSSGAYMM